MLVPNSYFLDNKITNWTLSDKIVRGNLKLGVAYGTLARKAEKILLQVTNDHSVVMVVPEPYVLFQTMERAP